MCGAFGHHEKLNAYMKLAEVLRGTAFGLVEEPVES